MNNQLQVPQGAAVDQPLLPQSMLDRVEDMHAGGLWAWTVTITDNTPLLAVVMANFPGKRTVRDVPFATCEEAQNAANFHNSQRGISEHEARNIVSSATVADYKRKKLSEQTESEIH